MAGPADNNFHLDTDQIAQIELGLNSRVDVAPVYTVWDFGTYLGSADAIYPMIENVIPAPGTVLEDNSAVIEAVIKDGSINGSMDTIKVSLDGKVVAHEYDAATGKVSTRAEDLPAGLHKLNIQFFCEDGKGILASSQIEVNNTDGSGEPDDNPGTDDNPETDDNPGIGENPGTGDNPGTDDNPGTSENPGDEDNKPGSGEDHLSGEEDGNKPEEDTPFDGQQEDNGSGDTGDGKQAIPESDKGNAGKKSPKTYDNSMDSGNQMRNTRGNFTDAANMTDTATAGTGQKLVNIGVSRLLGLLATVFVIGSGVCAAELRRRRRKRDD